MDILSLKLLNFRLIITYSGTLKMRQAPSCFFLKNPGDPLARARTHIIAAAGLPTRLVYHSLRRLLDEKGNASR